VAKAQILKRALRVQSFNSFIIKKYSFSMQLSTPLLLWQAYIFSHPYYFSSTRSNNTQITPSPPTSLDFNNTSQVHKKYSSSILSSASLECAKIARNFQFYKYISTSMGAFQNLLLLCHSLRRAAFDTDLRSVFNRQISIRSEFTEPS